mgnify:CR=1 FL=1
MPFVLGGDPRRCRRGHQPDNDSDRENRDDRAPGNVERERAVGLLERRTPGVAEAVVVEVDGRDAVLAERRVSGAVGAVAVAVGTALGAALPGTSRDVVVLLGHEPQLKWRTFTEQIISVASELNVELIVILGALLADVPHSRPVRVTGTAADVTGTSAASVPLRYTTRLPPPLAAG